MSHNRRLQKWESDALSDAEELYAGSGACAGVRIYQYLEEVRHSSKYGVIRTEAPEHILED